MDTRLLFGNVTKVGCLFASACLMCMPLSATAQQDDAQDDAAENVQAEVQYVDSLLSLAIESTGLTEEQDEQATTRIQEINEQIAQLNAEKEQLESTLAVDLALINGLTYLEQATELRERAEYLATLSEYNDLLYLMQDESETVSTHWIGVHCVPLSGEVRDFLELDESVGILIETIVEDSPAESSDLEVRDVIVDVDGSAITSVADLVEAIHQDAGSELCITVLRKGAELSIAITPQERPVDPAIAQNEMLFIPSIEYDLAVDAYSNEYFGNLFLNAQQNSQAQSLLLDPVQMDYLATVPMPANVGITLTQQGDSGVTLLIQKDENATEVELSKIEDLPADQQIYALAFLCRANQLTRLQVPSALQYTPQLYNYYVPQAANYYLPQAANYSFDQGAYYLLQNVQVPEYQLQYFSNEESSNEESLGGSDEDETLEQVLQQLEELRAIVEELRDR